MKYSTARKKRLRLRGHRKRRKAPDVAGGGETALVSHKICWTDYKTIRQYQSMGDQIERFIYGKEGLRRRISGTGKEDRQNGHFWLTREP